MTILILYYTDLNIHIFFSSAGQYITGKEILWLSGTEGRSEQGCLVQGRAMAVAIQYVVGALAKRAVLGS